MRPPEVLAQLSRDAEIPGLAEPFKGITANGKIEPGLFHIHSTGVSTAPVRHAAEQFLAGLTTEQRDQDAVWRRRPGVAQVDEPELLCAPGRQLPGNDAGTTRAGFGLLRASLSAKGVKQTRDIMRLNETLGELTGNNFDEYGEWRYHITIMGKPSATEPWGWQLDGHHAIINYFVLGDQVVMTPFFAGSEPVMATSGKYKGTAVLQEEQDAASR